MHKLTETREALGTLAYLDERTKLEQIEVEGKNTVIFHKDYESRHLFNIEMFVRDIEKGSKGGFTVEVTRYGRVKIHELHLGKQYYRLLNGWLEHYSDLYVYSARVNVFYDVCKEHGMIGEYPFSFGEPNELVEVEGMQYMELFDVLVEQIHVRCQSREFKERERLRRENAERNKKNVLAMEDAMFSEDTGRSRWLILSLTLRYEPEFRDGITVELLQRHRDRFFAAKRFNTLMSGIKGYVWAIEQGEKTGLHLHVVLFYSADHNHDEFIAQKIGEYWVDSVTEGKGGYWNSNAEWRKQFYEKRGHGIGVGQINWNDAEKRDALRKNLTYLAKAEQYVMVKETENIRTFDMGRVPKKVRAGRPRAVPGMPESENRSVA
ncbi:inovirus-type Gp2 protein [Cupriavidus oxalaticus]|uniref:Inovirus Gp2 family protein n=1 Tax=Cupriavidus oxalaticus TaxID=96344 RepID=A0A5P3VP53_9BURK|nr:inovirus-type Gp2 protein [Cupriavidus oxalaticus]QEZ48020.1 inovirus Gp2 family protein [Cupriavidus oxalaticus]